MEGIATETESHRIWSRKWRSALEDGRSQWRFAATRSRSNGELMMAYRGEDLDLRTPHNRPRESGQSDTLAGSSLNGLHPHASYSSRSSAIWVDEAVLASANHAFEIATAHRAAEVGVEHLLYAMTNVDEAAEALDRLGVRVTPLRVDVATAIAADLPASLTGASSTPRKSDALEDILRLASEMAGRRGVAAGVRDVLVAIQEHDRNHPAVRLLKRHLGRARPGTWCMRRAAALPGGSP